METIRLSVPNMKSPHCQMTVSNAVKALGANVIAVAPASIEVGLAEGLAKSDVVAAVEKAGYQVNN